MTSEYDRITQKYLRRYPNSKLTKSWAGRMVHIQTENGVWRINGKGYTYAHKQDAWVLSFEDAQKQVNHCGPEKQAAFIDATTRAVLDVPELVRYTLWHTLGRFTASPDGEYVRHDQAAAVIAAKDAEIERINTDIASYILSAEDQDKRRKNLEAKLAQIEKQEVIEVRKLEWHQISAANKSCLFTALNNQIGVRYYILEDTDKAIDGATISYTSQGLFGKSTCHYEDGHKSIDIAKATAQADYDKRITSCITAAPVASDAELRLERDRYKQALNEIIDIDGSWMQIALKSDGIAKNALNPSETRA